MGDIVPAASQAITVAATEEELEARAQRIVEAQELEAKLTAINQSDTRIFNVVGSCAGAGSGDFHYYRLIRRAEQDRLRKMEAEHRELTARQEFETKKQEAAQELESRTAKKRAKRLKKKAKKKQKAASGVGAAAGSGSGSDDSDVPGGAAPPQQHDLD